MQKKDTFLSEAVTVLKKLGGQAHLSEIYNGILDRGKLDFSNAKTPKATLSRTLQLNRGDHPKSESNTFYSIYGVDARKGYWGLVDNTIPKSEESLPYTPEDTSFKEGKAVLRKHIIRERSPKLVKYAKEKFRKEHNGKLYCEVCNFDFSAKYGELGEDFIEAHHTKPISKMKDNEETNINDIVMLCSNCHSMVHRKRPWLSKEQLKSILKVE